MHDKAHAAFWRFLSSRYATQVAIALGVALVLPSLTTGLAADDWFHRLILTGSNALRAVHHRPLDLFVFSNGDPSVGHTQQEAGTVAWWADPSAAIAFFRPLSALSHWLDYRLWPESAIAMHVQSVLWFVLALVGLSCVYRRLIEPRSLGVLALLLYAIDDAHGFVVSWVANRNALIALALGLPVLVLHDRGRRDRSRGAEIAAPLMFLVALLAGESAAAVGGYVLSYALFIDRATTRRRVISIVPYAAVFIAWRLLYAGLGYGTHGSGLAVDPAHDPIGFVRAAVVRLPVLLVAQLAAPPSDLWEIFPTFGAWVQPAVYGLALALLGIFAWLLAICTRLESATRFWVLGSVLAALPACSQVPSDRLLLFVGVGAHALIAQLIGRASDPEAGRAFPRGAQATVRIAIAALVVRHLLLAPIFLPIRARGAADVASLLALADRTLPSDDQRTVVLINPPADAFAGYIVVRRAAEGRPMPGKHLRWVATGASRLTVERLDDRSLRVEPDDGFLSLGSERMQRSAANPMPVGYRVQLEGMTVTVTRVTPDGRPKEIHARFEHPLEDPRLLFLHWTTDGYAPFVVPKVGQSTTLPAVDFSKLRIWNGAASKQPASTGSAK